MIENTLKSLQKKELYILDLMIDVLNAHDLSWYAYSGTLLGAVRHGGMIPWDDDIDIAMPREDYNRLQDNYKEWIKSPLFMQTPKTDNFFFSGCMKIRLDNTTFMAKDDYQADYHHGIFIDIFPIDSIPDKKEDQLSLFEHLRAYNKLFDSLYKCGKKGANPLYSEYCPSIYDGINSTLTLYSKINENSKYVAVPGFWYYELNFYKKNLIDPCNFVLRSSYDSYMEVPFKGLRNKIRVPSGYEQILDVSYGKNWRTPYNSHGHGKLVVDVDTDFKNYDNLDEDYFNSLLVSIADCEDSSEEESDSKSYKMSRKDAVPIVFSMDENYVPYCATTITSIIDNSDKRRKYDIYVFYSELSDESIQCLSGMSTENVKVHPLDVKPYIKDIAFTNVSWFTVEMYYRILIPKILPMYDKVIYVDCDTICGEDLSHLYDSVNFTNDEYIAACSDNKMGSGMKGYILDQLHLDPEQYINSGMLVLNSKLIRDNKLFDNLKEFLEEYNWLKFPDQDLINMYCIGRIKYLDHHWNFQHPRIMTDEDKIRYAHSCPGIVHFTAGDCKPWNNRSINLSQWFWYYAEKSPLIDVIYKRYLNQSLKKDIGRYFNNKDKFNDKIIVISSKGNIDSVSKIVEDGKSLDLHFSGNSYVAIVDNKNEFKKEISDSNLAEYKYKTDRGSIWVLSSYNGKNSSSAVKINKKTITFNKKGLNILILDDDTMNVVDKLSITC